MTTIALLVLLAQADPVVPAFSLGDDLEEALTVQSPEVSWGLGPRAGFLKSRGADSGTWFGGVQGRVWFSEYIGGEASITFHQDEFDDGFGGDVTVTYYPLELSILVYPIQDWKVKPYVVAGLGWYYTRIDFDNSAFDDETDNLFGFHIGIGADLPVSPRVILDADIRYVFLDEPSAADDEEFDLWQVTIGATFKF